MNNSAVVDYIRQQIKNGFDKNQIAQALLGSGWKQPDIEIFFAEAFKSIAQPEKITVKTASKTPMIIGLVVLLVSFLSGGFFIWNKYSNSKQSSNSNNSGQTTIPVENYIKDEQKQAVLVPTPVPDVVNKIPEKPALSRTHFNGDSKLVYCYDDEFAELYGLSEKDKDDIDVCYYDYAVYFKDVSLCNFILREDIKQPCVSRTNAVLTPKYMPNSVDSLCLPYDPQLSTRTDMGSEQNKKDNCFKYYGEHDSNIYACKKIVSQTLKDECLEFAYDGFGNTGIKTNISRVPDVSIMPNIIKTGVGVAVKFSIMEGADSTSELEKGPKAELLEVDSNGKVIRRVTETMNIENRVKGLNLFDWTFTQTVGSDVSTTKYFRTKKIYPDVPWPVYGEVAKLMIGSQILFERVSGTNMDSPSDAVVIDGETGYSVVKNEIIVMLDEKASGELLEKILVDFNARIIDDIPSMNTYHLYVPELDTKEKFEKIMKGIAGYPGVKAVETNGLMQLID